MVSVRNLLVVQGATFSTGFTWCRAAVDANGDPILDPATGQQTPGDPYDLTGCTARMQVRRKQGDPPLFTGTSADPGDPPDPALVAEGAGRIIIGGPYVDDGSGTGTLVLNPTNGRIDIVLTDEDTDEIAAKSAYYDLEIEWPIKPRELRPRVDRLLEGIITTDPNITQDVGQPVVT